MSDKYPGGFVTAGAPAGFSVVFDGSGDYLNLTDSSNLLDLGGAAKSLECFVYPTTTGTKIIAVKGGGAANWSTSDGFEYQLTYNSGSFNFTYNSSGSNVTISDPATSAINQWYYLVVATDASNNISLYVNGIRVATSTNAITKPTTRTTVNIAQDVSANYFTGYVSNLRFVSGSGAYNPTSTTLTLPTQLFPISGTQLLTCQSPTIIDNSTNAFTITAAGDAKVSNFTPFAGYTGFNPALGAAAGGVWTVDEAAYYQQNRLWPIYDPYFNQTTLMLHGNGTNAAQNNTFLDSSTNNFTITRNGNTTQGSFSPFSQTGWSNFFDGATNSYLALPSNTAFAFGTGAYTVEGWLYQTARSTNEALFFGANGASGFLAYITNTGAVNSGSVTGTAGNVPLNTWCHVAYVRSSTGTNATNIYVNGVVVATGTDATDWTSSGDPRIGMLTANTNYAIKGYISNFRIVKGTAVYTSAFTPSTTPLTAISGTSVLTCQSNRFLDISSNAFTVTPTGTMATQAFSPFVPAYITPTTYSNWFDGTGDYLTTPSSANLGFGNVFTVEYWLCLTTAPTASNAMYAIDFRSGSTNNYAFGVIASSGSTILYGYVGSGNGEVRGTTALSLNTWYHCAFVNNGTTMTGYLNGVSQGTYSTSFSQSTTSAVIGARYSGATEYIFGTLSNMRVLNGTALYTASFTPPTAPLTAITNTSLLTCQSSTFIDNSTNAFTITATGNVQPVTSPTPFPAKVDTTTLNSAYSTSLIGGSAYFDGTGDYLTIADTTALEPGSGDFTWEAWIYHTVAAGGTNNYTDQTGGGLAIYREPGGQVLVDSDGVVRIVTSATAIPINTWVHLAVTRSGSTARIFFNGVLNASNTNSTNIAGTSAIGIGGNPAGANLFTGGYMSNIRFIKGTALYTANFAPPITPFTAITNTQLLLNCTNGAIFDNTAKNVLETVGNAQISTTQSKWGGSSMYFDGTGDALLPPASKLLAFSTGDFTVELWVYPVAWDSNMVVIQGGSNGFGIQKYSAGSTGNIGVIINGGWVITDATLPTTGQWTHIAVARAGGVLRFFVNGTISGSTPANTSDISDGIKNIGGEAGQTYFNGYMDDIRVTKGVARYITNFTPPTSALQNQ